MLLKRIQVKLFQIVIIFITFLISLFAHKMSAFTKKLNQIKQSFASDYGLKKPLTSVVFSTMNNKRTQVPLGIDRVKSLSRCEIKLSSPECRQQNYLIRHPVIIQTKNSKKKSYSTYSGKDIKYSSVKKTVQAFVPLIIPTRDRNYQKQQLKTAQSSCRNRQIQIFIEKDKPQSKQCLQKLFKKIQGLEQKLTSQQKQRHRLQIQIEHLRKRNTQYSDQQKLINRLQGDKYKLQRQVQLLKREIKDQNRRMPKETVKEIIVQKPVQVRVQVPKYIAGPQRIVQVQKKVPYQVIIKSPPQMIQRPVYIEVEKPVYVDKPVYIDKPVYVQNPVQKIIYVDKPIYINNPIEKIVQRKVQIPVEVPYQVPVYIDRPVVDQQWMMRLQSIEQQLGMRLRQTHQIKSDNHRLRLDNQNMRSTIDQINLNMQVLQQHNEEKNREIQLLLRNGRDYVPISNDSFTTRDNSFNFRHINYLSDMPSPKSKRYYS